MSKMIAVVCADIHFSHKAPLARADEPDWYAAMERVMEELCEIVESEDGARLLIAGDVFDRWNSPPELINFAMRELPAGTWAIPGQHDLPLHSYTDLRRSAYMTLVLSETMHSIPVDTPVPIGPFDVYGFPYGFPITPCKRRRGRKAIALAHRYVDANLGGTSITRPDILFTYDTIFFGDNHIPFAEHFGNTLLVNCGTLMRRHAEDINSDPAVYMLFEDGSVKPHRVETLKDIFTVPSQEEEREQIDLQDFVETLGRLENGKSFDFREVVNRLLDSRDVRHAVRAAILEAMGDGRD
jgi:DNA repair exonuclease SbcCD nuclease subunit